MIFFDLSRGGTRVFFGGGVFSLLASVVSMISRAKSDGGSVRFDVLLRDYLYRFLSRKGVLSAYWHVFSSLPSFLSFVDIMRTNDLISRMPSERMGPNTG